MPTPTQTGRVHEINPIGVDGVVRCYCETAAALLVSQTAMNPGREFYACRRNRDDPDKCKFFKWKDDLPQPPPSPSQPRFSVPPSPSPSQRHRIELSRTPRKRGRSPTPPPLTPSQKRLANIQAALGTPTSTANKNKAEADDDALFSAFSSPPAIPDTPREPKRMRGYMPMTPPRDADGGHREGGGRGGAFPETPSKSKGKGRECAGMDDAENPFHAPTSPPGPDESQLPSVIAGVHLLPAYIAKLQRQKVAAERSSEAKERRIEELQGEVERMTNKIRVLEETIAAEIARQYKIK